jgi:hypothetical protein
MSMPTSDEVVPHHGDPGVREAFRTRLPSGLTVALSREVGSRGGSIARRLGRQLGWPVYTQEELDYLIRPGPDHDRILADAGPQRVAWAEQRLQHLLREQRLSGDPGMIESARIILVLGATGEVVFLGRAAGYLLPARTTLHARIIAPRSDRMAYLSQWMRLTPEEAAEQLRRRETRRADFLAEHVRRPSADLDPFDLLLNSTRLGEEACAELLSRAVRAKLDSWGEELPDSPAAVG